jgi:hypothetical protein
MDLILISDCISFDEFMTPVSIDVSLDVMSIFSVSDSEYSECCTEAVIAAAYDKFIRHLSGHDGA